MRVPRFRLWGFKTPADLLGPTLGSLEQQVMAILWEAGLSSVHDVRRRLPDVAYTTLMTTLDRLHRKGLVTRVKIGRAFRYEAAGSADEIENEVASDLLQSLLERDQPAPLLLSNLVDAVGERNRDLLDVLERLVRQKRRALSKRPRR